MWEIVMGLVLKGLVLLFVGLNIKAWRATRAAQRKLRDATELFRAATKLHDVYSGGGAPTA